MCILSSRCALANTRTYKKTQEVKNSIPNARRLFVNEVSRHALLQMCSCHERIYLNPIPTMKRVDNLCAVMCLETPHHEYVMPLICKYFTPSVTCFAT